MRWAGPVSWAGLVNKKQQQNNLFFTIHANLTTPVTWDPGIAMPGSRSTSNEYRKLDFNTDKPKYTKT